MVTFEILHLKLLVRFQLPQPFFFKMLGGYNVVKKALRRTCYALSNFSVSLVPAYGETDVAVNPALYLYMFPSSPPTYDLTELTAYPVPWNKIELSTKTNVGPSYIDYRFAYNPLFLGLSLRPVINLLFIILMLSLLKVLLDSHLILLLVLLFLVLLIMIQVVLLVL